MAVAKPPHTTVSLAVFLLLQVQLFFMVFFFFFFKKVDGMWCVARSEANDKSLQTALDYACFAGADCAPLQSTGLCFLPNTLQAHASYAFNSYYQRKRNDPGSCIFAGTATIAKTDPSYGSCVYPPSPNTAGGGGGTTLSSNGGGGGGGINNATVSLNTPPPPPGNNIPLYGNGGLTPGFDNGGSGTDQSSQDSLRLCIMKRLILEAFMLVLCLL